MVNMFEYFNHELVGCVHSLVAINIFLKSKIFFFLAKSPLNWLYKFVKLKKKGYFLLFIHIYPLAYFLELDCFCILQIFKINNFFIFFFTLN